MKILMHTKWNTGRLYREDGQPIEAWLIEEGPHTSFVYFMDKARMIDGFISTPNTFPITNGGESMLQSWTLQAYDMNQYQHSIQVREKYVTGHSIRIDIKEASEQ